MKIKSKNKKSFYLFSFNHNQENNNENTEKIKIGKNFTNEFDPSLSYINFNNDNINENFKIIFDNVIIKNILNNNINDIKKINTFETKEKFELIELNNYDNPTNYLKDIKEKINKNFKNNNDFLINACNICHKQLDIRIDSSSNAILIYCNNCKIEPKGLSLQKYFEEIKNQNSLVFICQKCKNFLNYDFEKGKFFCDCESTKKFLKKISIRKIEESNTCIPFFLKDTYCNTHKMFHKYYLKYSKKGLCSGCYKDKYKHNYFIEEFNEEKINILIKNKKEELKLELNFIQTLKDKINSCLKEMKEKFEKILKTKTNFCKIKSELINSFEVIKNNYTIFSNVNSLKFDFGKNFNYKEDDTVENRLKYLNDYLNFKSDINNICFGNKNEKGEIIHNGPYNNLKQNDAEITDICGINNNKLICVSFNNGQAKIFDIKPNNNYPICIINEFLPKEGINSLYINQNDKSFWKINSSNKNDIIYLNGYEEIKIIQMKDNYDSYNVLYNIKDEGNYIYFSSELDYNSILSLDNYNNIKIIYLNKDKGNIIETEIKNITKELINSEEAKSFEKLSKNIFSFKLSSFNDLANLVGNNNDRFTLNEEVKENKNTNILKKTDAIKISEFNNKSLNLDLLINRRNSISDHNFSDTTINNEDVKFTKIFNFEVNDSENNKKNNYLKIKNEFIFKKDYEVIGCLSNKDNLLFINYNDKNKCFEGRIYIFNFNIYQFINCYNFHNVLNLPKLFIKISNNYFEDKNGFIICDNDLNLFQYFYDKNYTQKIYYINNSLPEKKVKCFPLKGISLDNKLILFCSNNNYYLLNYK